MLDERRADTVEIEILSLSPPRVRVRGASIPAAEAVRALLEGNGSVMIDDTEPAEELHRETEAAIPSRNDICQWLTARAGAPYTLIDLVSQLTHETEEVVRSRFYVRAGRDQRRVGSDYRAACLTRHGSCARELEAEGWRLIEKRLHQSPTEFRLLPAEATDASSSD